VGAAYYFYTPRCGTSPAQLESYSSGGGTPILFDSSGTRLATPVVRQKPDFVGPDGVNNTFLGIQGGQLFGGPPHTTIPQCEDGNYPMFFGTSAATPHAAAVAALIEQANPGVTPDQIYTVLRSSAAAMRNTTPDFESGYGFIQADAALALLPPPPTLTLSQTSIVVGESSTLAWTSGATGCTASGSWSGPQGATGSVTVSPSPVGSYSYTLACVNAYGPSAPSTVTLTVKAIASPAPGRSGGGALDGAALLALAGFVLARATVRRCRL
jgi:subtilisin family serine protease